MKKEVKIGLAGIASLVILFFGINYLKGRNMFKPDSYYMVDFTNINGLAKSSPVYANGYKIGIVRDIAYNHSKPGHVAVEIEVDENIRVPEGSWAELVSEMLGTVKMNVFLNYGNTKYCLPGDTIVGKTNEGVLSAAEKELMPQIGAMLPKLDSIMTSLNKLLGDEALVNTLHNIESLTATLNHTSRKLNTFINDSLPAITSNVTCITNDMKVISNNLKDVDYASTFSKIDSTLQNVNYLTSKLKEKGNSLGMLFNDKELYDELKSVANSANVLINDLKDHPKRYVHFSLFGKKDK